MQADPLTQAVSNPRDVLDSLDWIAVVVSMSAGVAAPWLCGRMLQRRLGCLASLAVGTLASGIAYGLMDWLDAFFRRSVILDLLVLAFVGVAAMLAYSMRKP